MENGKEKVGKLLQRRRLQQGEPIQVTLDTNLFFDKAEGREGASDFDEIIELARGRRIELFFTATTDFEDSSGAAWRTALKLIWEGLLKEDRNCGTPGDFMPGGPGLHLVDESRCEELLRHIWPNGRWKSASENKRSDVLHLLAHLLNGRDIFLTRDKKLLARVERLNETFHIRLMSPKDLLAGIGVAVGRRSLSIGMRQSVLQFSE